MRLSGHVLLLGPVRVMVVPNDRKVEGSKHPDFFVIRLVGEKWERVGALWNVEEKLKREGSVSFQPSPVALMEVEK